MTLIVVAIAGTMFALEMGRVWLRQSAYRRQIRRVIRQGR